jgi:hypothetical protein
LLSPLLLLTFLLSDSAAFEIHDVHIVPAAAVISDVNSVHAVVGLPPGSCRLCYFCMRHFCVGRPVGFHSCCCLQFLLLWAGMLLQSSLLLLVAGVTAIACIPAVTGIPAVAGDPLVFDVLAVARLPGVVGVPPVAFFPTVAGVLAFDDIPADPGVHNFAAYILYMYCTADTCTI